MFRGALVKAAPNTGGTQFRDDGSLPTANKHVDLAFVRDVVDEAKAKYLVPYFDGENYMCVCSVKFGRRVREDPDWEDAAKYGG